MRCRGMRWKQRELMRVQARGDGGWTKNSHHGENWKIASVCPGRTQGHLDGLDLEREGKGEARVLGFGLSHGVGVAPLIKMETTGEGAQV